MVQLHNLKHLHVSYWDTNLKKSPMYQCLTQQFCFASSQHYHRLPRDAPSVHAECMTALNPRRRFMSTTAFSKRWYKSSLQWRHNKCDGVSNHRCFDCLPHRLSRRRSKKTLKLRVTGLCEGNSPVTGEFPAQSASNSENVSIWWRHRVKLKYSSSRS